jgi:hypothetical protein
MAKIKHATLIEEFEDRYLQTLLSMWHFLFWPLCCLSFFDLQLHITPLVSSNSIEEFEDTKWVI